MGKDCNATVAFKRYHLFVDVEERTYVVVADSVDPGGHQSVLVEGKVLAVASQSC